MHSYPGLPSIEFNRQPLGKGTSFRYADERKSARAGGDKGGGGVGLKGDRDEDAGRGGGEIFHSSRTTPRESEIKLSVRRTFDSDEKFSALPSFRRRRRRVHHYLHLRYLNLAGYNPARPPLHRAQSALPLKARLPA